MSSEDPFGGLFGDPDEMRKRMTEFAEQMQGAQKVAWADNAIKLAVEMTVPGSSASTFRATPSSRPRTCCRPCAWCFPKR